MQQKSCSYTELFVCSIHAFLLLVAAAYDALLSPFNCEWPAQSDWHSLKQLAIT
jgi:hypothetical protein